MTLSITTQFAGEPASLRYRHEIVADAASVAVNVAEVGENG